MKQVMYGSVAGSALVSIMTATPLWDAAWLSLAALAGTTTLWIVGNIAAERVYRKAHDAYLLSEEICPVCDTQGAVYEVSSDPIHIIVGCKACGNHFDVRGAHGGLVVTRLGVR